MILIENLAQVFCVVIQCLYVLIDYHVSKFAINQCFLKQNSLANLLLIRVKSGHESAREVLIVTIGGSCGVQGCNSTWGRADEETLE